MGAAQIVLTPVLQNRTWLDYTQSIRVGEVAAAGMRTKYWSRAVHVEGLGHLFHLPWHSERVVSFSDTAVLLRLLYSCDNKLYLFSWTTLTNWLLKWRSRERAQKKE
jgi:hypothetical protein